MLKSTFCILALVFLLAGCGKENLVIPDVPVNFNSPLSDPRLSRLNSPGGAVTINGYGVAGLVIYRRADNAYVAYDRCSTVNPPQKCAVILDDPTITVTDPCTGAKFSLYDGSPVKAPAKLSLKQYTVAIAGNNLQVTN